LRILSLRIGYIGPIGQNTASAHRRRVCGCLPPLPLLLSGVLLGGGGYMTAPAPLVPGRWEGVCQDFGTGDWTGQQAVITAVGVTVSTANAAFRRPERD